VSEADNVVRRALGYPYRPGQRPFVLFKNRVADLDVEFNTNGRITLIAYGANASSGPLVDKLTDTPEPILVEPTWLEGFDAVYSAHISPYGAVPATLQSSPGTSIRAAFVYLTEEQVEQLSASEPNYDLVTSWGCRYDQGLGLGEMQTYLSRHGCLAVEGSAIAVAAVEAKGRRLSAMTEREALEWVRDLVCPELSLEDFIVTSVADPELAKARTAALAAQAKEPSLPLLDGAEATEGEAGE
jgi:hypothetical protein